MEGAATKLTKQCEEQRQQARPWSSTCDYRSLRPGTVKVLPYQGYLRPKPIPINEQEKYSECLKNTVDRCTWKEISRNHSAIVSSDPIIYRYLFVDNQLEDKLNNAFKVQREKPNSDSEIYVVYYQLSCPKRVTNDQAADLLVVGGGKPDVGAKAVEAALRLDLPKPKPRLMLFRDDPEVNYTLVRGHTWFGTDPAGFTHHSARADADGVWVEVTAVPAGLGFTANGQPWAWCAAPGTSFDGKNLADLERFQGLRPLVNPAPGGCSKQFETTSPGLPDQPVRGKMQIRWQVSWIGSGHQTGTLPDMFTSIDTEPFAVTEAQTLVTK